ncbi:MAG: fatty-acid--CoA ligase [Chloroflexi bacterium]|nr:MAG: fatty-acid--CoA ligase [Chloroflexota bacterium]
MMDYQLTLQPILQRGYRLFPKKEIASKFGDTMHRYTYADFYGRVGQLANALTKLGVNKGDRIGTFAWNSYRHLELYFGVPCMGAVVHTLNLRLPPDQLAYIVNHAEDQIIFVDNSLVPLLERVAGELKTVKHYVIMGDVAETSLPNTLSYEDLIGAESADFAWPQLDENDAAGMCYTSGTTGNPKGALYSHRAIFLHTMGLSLTDTAGLSERDVVMPVVPMFHAMAWGLPFAATYLGSKLVFPGAHMQPQDLAGLIQDERVTLAAGVPSLWFGLQTLLEQGGYDTSSVRAMIVGGSAAPRSMIEGFEKNFGIPILHAWGMTEMTPLGTVANLKSYMDEWPDDERYAVRAKQGIAVPGVELRGIDENGDEIPWDGKTMGELQVRGPWIIRAYYQDERSENAFMNGWFRTGDVVTIDPEGYVQIVDRTKDLVKSGGEWISTVDLENAIMAHPDVLEASVIAVPHPKWVERPLAIVVTRPDLDTPLEKEAIYAMLSAEFAKWQLPDDIVFIDEIPKTSVGKFDKKVLRAQFQDYKLPTA